MLNVPVCIVVVCRRSELRYGLCAALIQRSPLTCLQPNVFASLSSRYGQWLSPPWPVKAVQRWIKAVTGVALPLLQGTGLFGERWGLLPRPRAITTVYGAAVPVAKCVREGGPSADDIALVQTRYIAALEALFEEHREQVQPGARLVIK